MADATPAHPVLEDRSIPMERAVLYLFILAAPLVLLEVAAFALTSGLASLGAGVDAMLSLGVFLPVMAVGIVAHEAIHGLTWAALGRLPRSAIRFGVQWKTATPYAHAIVPLPAWAYRWGTAMPLLLLGLLPALAGIGLRDARIAGFGMLFTLVAGGDLAVLWLMRGLPRHAWVQDHPERAGCLVVQPGREGHIPRPLSREGT